MADRHRHRSCSPKKHRSCSPKSKRCEEKDRKFEEFDKPIRDKELDRITEKVLAIYQSAFPDAFIFPKIGLPSQNGQRWGLITFTATRKGEQPNFPAWNEYIVRSPLDNNALTSLELSQQKGEEEFTWSNRFEIMLPDIPGADGALGSTEFYVTRLQDCGIDAKPGKAPVIVNGNHYHWPSTPITIKGKERTNYAIHSSALGLDPIVFAKHQAKVLVDTLKYIDTL